MSYGVRILPVAARQIAKWNLPESILVEVYLRLKTVLVNDPAQILRPSTDPDGGMEFLYSLIDPGNRLCEHTFLFRVYYHPDETTLLIASAIYRQQIGF